MDHARSIGATVKHRAPGFCRPFACILLTVAVIFCGAEWARAQGDGFERTFPQSKASVEKALKAMQSSTAGRLPVLNGFASAADHPMDSYQRGFYQAKFQVSAAPSGGSIVRVSVEVTAWHTDPVAARSGYELLTSNGRLEADLLDQLADQLAGKAPQAATGSPARSDSRPFPSMQRAGAAGASSSEQFLAEHRVRHRRLPDTRPKLRMRRRALFLRRSPGFHKPAAVSPLLSRKVSPEKIRPRRGKKTSLTMTRAVCERKPKPARNSEKPGPSQESGCGRKNRNPRSGHREFDSQDFVPGKRAR